MINFKDWTRAAGIRAIKTIAQTAIATIGTAMVIADVDWIVVLSTSLVAGVLSILTSLTGLPEAETSTAEAGYLEALAIQKQEGSNEALNTIAATAESTDLSMLTVAALKAMAKAAGVTGYSKLTKTALIELLNNAEVV